MKELFFETKDIGVGEFSVLQCFCARHDNALFAPLENEPLTFSPEQITLLHYRAIAAEAYQQGNQEDAAAAQARKYSSHDPRKGVFFSIFQMHSLAAETAEDALKRLERNIERKRYEKVCALIVRFEDKPVILSVGAFRPLYDVAAQQLQTLEPHSAYVAMHLLAAEDKAVLVFTWLRGQRAAERFAKQLVAQPPKQLTTLAIQVAFEYAEHTCMREDWWLQLDEPVRDVLLWRVKEANSLGYIRTSRCISFYTPYDDWSVESIQLVQ